MTDVSKLDPTVKRLIYVGCGLLALLIGGFAFTRLGRARAERADQARVQQAEATKQAQDSVKAAQRVILGSRGVAPVARPEHVRALYLNAWAAGSQKKLAKLIDMAVQTEVNAFVIDVKEAGELSYKSDVALAKEVDASREYIRNVRTLLTKLKDNDIFPIARIVVFKDPLLATARPALAIKNRDGSLWLDNKGTAWVDSYNKKVWDYNIALAREAIELGFAEIQWDYVRFPDAPKAFLNRAVYPAAAGRRKDDAIREFMLYAREKLADTKVPLTADVFGLTVSTTGDMGIGQQWEKMIDAVDVILPMVYPSHFITGNYGLKSPNAAPYRTIKSSMEDAIKRSQVPNAAIIRPWLQAFTLGPPRYGPEHVRAQIDAVLDVGLHEWVLWSPGSNYDPAALALEGQPPPKFEVPGGRGPVKRDTVVSDSLGQRREKD